MRSEQSTGNVVLVVDSIVGPNPRNVTLQERGWRCITKYPTGRVGCRHEVKVSP